MLSKPPLPRGEPLLNVKPIKLWRLNQPKGDPLITGGCCWLRFALHPNPNLIKYTTSNFSMYLHKPNDTN